MDGGESEIWFRATRCGKGSVVWPVHWKGVAVMAAYLLAAGVAVDVFAHGIVPRFLVPWVFVAEVIVATLCLTPVFDHLEWIEPGPPLRRANDLRDGLP